MKFKDILGHRVPIGEHDIDIMTDFDKERKSKIKIESIAKYYETGNEVDDKKEKEENDDGEADVDEVEEEDDYDEEDNFSIESDLTTSTVSSYSTNYLDLQMAGLQISDDNERQLVKNIVIKSSTLDSDLETPSTSDYTTDYTASNDDTGSSNPPLINPLHQQFELGITQVSIYEDIMPLRSMKMVNFFMKNLALVRQYQQVFLTVCVDCAYGGRRVYTRLTATNKLMFEAKFTGIKHGGKINISLFCAIGHYLIYAAHLNDFLLTKGFKVSRKKLERYIGGLHIWDKPLDTSHMTFIKAKIIRGYLTTKFDNNTFEFIKYCCLLDNVNN